jgi:hypothetical protein
MISFKLQQKLEITQFNSSTDTRTHHTIVAENNCEELNVHVWPAYNKAQNKGDKEYHNAECFSDVVLTFLRKLAK